MSQIISVGTYVPPWEKGGRRVKGFDEDALTMAVAAGRAADPDAAAERVVLVSRDFPLLEGGNGAVLLAGLSLPDDTPVAEVLGGGPAALDQLTGAPESTLVIGADDNEAAVGAVAVLTGAPSGTVVSRAGSRSASLPMRIRGGDGARHTYPDPRLQREVGIKASLARLHISPGAKLAAVAGVSARVLGSTLDVGGAVDDPAVSAGAALRVLVAAVDDGKSGLVLAFEQSSVTAVELAGGQPAAAISRDEAPGREQPKAQYATGNGIPISLPAYARAFDSKLRWEAAVYGDRPGVDDVPMIPPRLKVDAAGRLINYELQPLPRTGTVYTHTTIRIPVPDLPSPYSLAVVQLDGSPVRVLLKVTGVAAGETDVGQQGSVVLRKIATRAGIPDYGYAFWPGKQGVST